MFHYTLNYFQDFDELSIWYYYSMRQYFLKFCLYFNSIYKSENIPKKLLKNNIKMFSPVRFPSMIQEENTFSSTRRNYMLSTHRKDGLIEWMKEMLHHSFALNAKETYVGTMDFFEELINEHRDSPEDSRLKQLVPSVGHFHTSLPLGKAFKIYDKKYSISKRRCIAPSFNEIRHIMNLAQIIAIGEKLKMISFDGDQTLYSDGGNFDATNDELALGLIRLLNNNVKVILITAAGYGLDGRKYEIRLEGLLKRFQEEKMTKEQIENFYVFGGECNYLLQCTLFEPVSPSENGNSLLEPHLLPVPIDAWQNPKLNGPKPHSWPRDQVQTVLDIAEESMREAVGEMKLRAKVLRKDRAVGVYPGGPEMVKQVPIGHGSRKLKQEALDEIVLRVMEEIRNQKPPITLPYCVFNGGADAWLDVGNKSIAIQALQAYFQLQKDECIHVGDQVINNKIYNTRVILSYCLLLVY